MFNIWLDTPSWHCGAGTVILQVLSDSAPLLFNVRYWDILGQEGLDVLNQRSHVGIYFPRSGVGFV